MCVRRRAARCLALYCIASCESMLMNAACCGKLRHTATRMSQCAVHNSSANVMYIPPQRAKQESLALASMARDDSPASSTASSTAPASSTAAAAAQRPQCAVKWDRNLKPKLAIMRQCTSVTDRRADGLASWHKREMYILHLALKTKRTASGVNEP